MISMIKLQTLFFLLKFAIEILLKVIPVRGEICSKSKYTVFKLTCLF